jgi:hypothetical protein
MRLVKLALVIGAAALLASPALAQIRGNRGGLIDSQRLLSVEKVQKDLGLDKDGAKKAQDALQKVYDDTKDEQAKLRRDSNASDEEKAAARKKINEAQDKALKDTLSEKQMKRLKQIERQITGIAIFQQEDVQKSLKLTDEQKGKIKEINTDLQKEMEGLRTGGFKPDNIAKSWTMRKDAMDNAVKVLKDDQKKELKELTGEPLELKLEDFGGGRGRGGKPGGDKPLSSLPK